ncbi:MAG: hypothetical protein AVDCRST_MAG38-705 [uncultured Solirubrobacteraceae bacterium]|uniref:Uncharacterized protein n=1 Tax=uncultured Solirubrobacteraceae bacterium TaxID=1162706 RepID=A0A6J4RFA0_9ACTN|nr:MAG: hypothetical protein AVDCRST_MAG38-705 [uncultured Solirubrobacteraceae bacterium]
MVRPGDDDGGPPCVVYIGIETSARTRQRGHSDRAKRRSRRWIARPHRGQFRYCTGTSQPAGGDAMHAATATSDSDVLATGTARAALSHRGGRRASFRARRRACGTAGASAARMARRLGSMA